MSHHVHHNKPSRMNKLYFCSLLLLLLLFVTSCNSFSSSTTNFGWTTKSPQQCYYRFIGYSTTPHHYCRQEQEPDREQQRQRQKPQNIPGLQLFAAVVDSSSSSSSSCSSRQRLQLPSAPDDDDDDVLSPMDCPRGYYLNSVENSCTPLGPIGKISQAVETFGPFQKVHRAISNLCGADIKTLGVPFALSYSFMSQINGSITLSVAWYLACKNNGISPLAPGQWKSLLRAYATLYAAVQLLRPFRVAGAVAMSKMSKQFLHATEQKLNCSRKTAIVVQYGLGWVAWASLASVGITVATLSSGVPLWPSSGAH